MSAFLCSPRHIAAVVNAVPTHRLGSNNDRRDMFHMLAVANANSVNYRYDDATECVDGYVYDSRVTVTPIEALKLAQSLRYQSCEVPNWNETDAAYLLATIVSEITCDLPGYSAAAWSI